MSLVAIQIIQIVLNPFVFLKGTVNIYPQNGQQAAKESVVRQRWDVVSQIHSTRALQIPNALLHIRRNVVHPTRNQPEVKTLKTEAASATCRSPHWLSPTCNRAARAFCLAGKRRSPTAPSAVSGGASAGRSTCTGRQATPSDTRSSPTFTMRQRT